MFDKRFQQFESSNGEILEYFRSEIDNGRVMTINTSDTTERSWEMLQDQVDGRLTTRVTPPQQGERREWLLQQGGSGAESMVEEDE